MEYKGKVIKGLEIYDSTNEDKVIAHICDNFLELDNGYKIRIIPLLEEKCEQ